MKTPPGHPGNRPKERRAHQMIGHQIRYELITFFRNRQSLFFAVVLPVMFLAIFVATFGNDSTLVNGHQIKLSTYYVPSLVAMGVISATFVNLSVSITHLARGGTRTLLRAAAGAFHTRFMARNCDLLRCPERCFLKREIEIVTKVGAALNASAAAAAE